MFSRSRKPIPKLIRLELWLCRISRLQSSQIDSTLNLSIKNTSFVKFGPSYRVPLRPCPRGGGALRRTNNSYRRCLSVEYSETRSSDGFLIKKVRIAGLRRACASPWISARGRGRPSGGASAPWSAPSSGVAPSSAAPKPPALPSPSPVSIIFSYFIYYYICQIQN